MLIKKDRKIVRKKFEFTIIILYIMFFSEQSIIQLLLFTYCLYWYIIIPSLLVITVYV